MGILHSNKVFLNQDIMLSVCTQVRHGPHPQEAENLVIRKKQL